MITRREKKKQRVKQINKWRNMKKKKYRFFLVTSSLSFSLIIV